MITWFPLSLAVIVGTDATFQKTQPVHRRQTLWARVRHALLKPTVQSGALSRKDNSLIPCLSQNHIHTLRLPQSEHIQRASGSDEDRVGGQQTGSELLHQLRTAKH